MVCVGKTSCSHCCVGVVGLYVGCDGWGRDEDGRRQTCWDGGREEQTAHICYYRAGPCDITMTGVNRKLHETMGSWHCRSDQSRGCDSKKWWVPKLGLRQLGTVGGGVLENVGRDFPGEARRSQDSREVMVLGVFPHRSLHSRRCWKRVENPRRMINWGEGIFNDR